jgi:hypothetical protein
MVTEEAGCGFPMDITMIVELAGNCVEIVIAILITDRSSSSTRAGQKRRRRCAAPSCHDSTRWLMRIMKNARSDYRKCE